MCCIQNDTYYKGTAKKRKKGKKTFIFAFKSTYFKGTANKQKKQFNSKFLFCIKYEYLFYLYSKYSYLEYKYNFFLTFIITLYIVNLCQILLLKITLSN